MSPQQSDRPLDTNQIKRAAKIVSLKRLHTHQNSLSVERAETYKRRFQRDLRSTKERSNLYLVKSFAVPRSVPSQLEHPPPYKNEETPYNPPPA